MTLSVPCQSMRRQSGCADVIPDGLLFGLNVRAIAWHRRLHARRLERGIAYGLACVLDRTHYFYFRNTASQFVNKSASDCV
jgi:hypothetical protein